MSMQTTLVFEPAAREVVDATSKPPFLYEMGPEERAILEELQSAPIEMPSVDERWFEVECPLGDVRVRIVRPAGVAGALPAVVYMHGGGWVLGSAATHDRLVRQLAVGANAAVAFVEYASLRRLVIPSRSSRRTRSRRGSHARARPRG